MISGAALTLAFVGGSAGLAGAQSSHHRNLFGRDGASHVVFVQTDNLAGNQVVAYDRSHTGTLALAGHL